ncbi:hypothetical protein ACFLR4_03555 [Bacteroidota bacterium]
MQRIGKLFLFLLLTGSLHALTSPQLSRSNYETDINNINRFNRTDLQGAVYQTNILSNYGIHINNLEAVGTINEAENMQTQLL